MIPIEIIHRTGADLKFGDNYKRGDHNVNNENIKELVPFKTTRYELGWNVEISKVFWDDMLSIEMQDGIRSFINNYDERESEVVIDNSIQQTHTEDELSVDVLLGLTEEVVQSNTVTADPSKVKLKNELIISTEWKYPNDILRSATPIQLSFSKAIYNCYLNFYDYENWANNLHLSDIGIQDDETTLSFFILQETSESDMSELVNLARTRVLSGRGLPRDAIERFSPKLISFIESKIKYSLDRGFPGVFAKMSGKSAKNDVVMRPLTSVSEVIENLTISKDIIGWLGAAGCCTSSFVILPWNPRITPENEFRAFMKNNKISGISKQRWWSTLSPTINKEKVTKAIVDLCESLSTKLPFPSATLDIWYCSNSSSAYLIECNPWGAFFSSGSSLFSWRDHYAELHNTDRIAFAELDKDVVTCKLP